MSDEIIENTHLAKQFIQQVGDPNAVIAAVEKCLEIFPPGKIRIRLYETENEVRREHWELYEAAFNGRSFVQKSTDTIHISVQKKWFQSSLQEVFAREVARVLLERHFGPNTMPSWMHELNAQYVVAHYRRYM